MHWQFKSSLELKLVIWIFRNFFFLMYAQKWPLFFLKHGKKIPFLGYTRKIRELSIIPAYGGTIAWFALAPWFFRHFCTIKCRHLTDQKVNSLRKLESMGNQLYRENLLCRIFWLIFFVFTPKRGFSFRVSGKKSGHFCACMRKNKVCYTGGRGWFSLVFCSLIVKYLLCAQKLLCINWNKINSIGVKYAI